MNSSEGMNFAESIKTLEDGDEIQILRDGGSWSETGVYKSRGDSRFFFLSNDPDFAGGRNLDDSGTWNYLWCCTNHSGADFKRARLIRKKNGLPITNSMRRAMDKGSVVKVVNTSDYYSDLADKAAELGGTARIFNKSAPVANAEGVVVGVDKEKGYVLVDFAGTNQILFGSEAIQFVRKSPEINYLVRYSHNNSIEEFSEMDDVNTRINELVSGGHLKISDTVKCYHVESVKVMKLGLSISLE